MTPRQLALSAAPPLPGRHVTELYRDSGLPLAAFLELVRQARTVAGRDGPWLAVLVSLLRQAWPDRSLLIPTGTSDAEPSTALVPDKTPRGYGASARNRRGISGVTKATIRDPSRSA